MSFFETQFPPRISVNMTGGPMFLTSKSSTTGGQRVSNRRSQMPLHKYSFNKPTLSDFEFEDIRAFIYCVGADADGFRFKDWSDYQVDVSISAMTLVSSGVYQMGRKYVFGSRTFTRSIYKPVAGASIFRTRSSVTTDITSVSTIDYTTGKVTVTGDTPGDVYTWSGEFDVPVAFVDNSIAWLFIGGPDRLTEWSGIEVEEFRL